MQHVSVEVTEKKAWTTETLVIHSSSHPLSVCFWNILANSTMLAGANNHIILSALLCHFKKCMGLLQCIWCAWSRRSSGIDKTSELLIVLIKSDKYSSTKRSLYCIKSNSVSKTQQDKITSRKKVYTVGIHKVSIVSLYGSQYVLSFLCIVCAISHVAFSLYILQYLLGYCLTFKKSFCLSLNILNTAEETAKCLQRQRVTWNKPKEH